MGILQEADGTRHTLSARCILGRDPACEVVVQSGRVSAEHASLRWMGDDRWELRDLGSKNGTWLGDRRLAGGERAKVSTGDAFGLGDRARLFTLVDASEPVATARRVGTSIVRVARDRLLVLPDEAEPLTTILEEGGVWVAESESEKRPVADRDVLRVAAEEWVLELPRFTDETWESGAAAPTLAAIALHLGVSRDEEHVEVTVVHGESRTTLPPRTGHYLLVLLARARLSDNDARPDERGWVDRDALCRMLRFDTNRLNVEICRLRKQLAKLGVSGISGMVARRPSTAQVRLAIDHVDLTPL